MPEDGPVPVECSGVTPEVRGAPSRAQPPARRPCRSRQRGQSPAGAFASRAAPQRGQDVCGIHRRNPSADRTGFPACSPTSPSDIKQTTGSRYRPSMIIPGGSGLEGGEEVAGSRPRPRPARPAWTRSRGGAARRSGGGAGGRRPAPRPRSCPCARRPPRRRSHRRCRRAGRAGASKVAALPASSYSRPSWSRTRPSRVSAQLRSKIRSGVSPSASSSAYRPSASAASIGRHRPAAPALPRCSRSRRLARKWRQTVRRKARNRPRVGSASASRPFSSSAGEEVLGQVAGLLGAVASSSDIGVQGVPVGVAELARATPGPGARPGRRPGSPDSIESSGSDRARAVGRALRHHDRLPRSFRNGRRVMHPSV